MITEPLYTLKGSGLRVIPADNDLMTLSDIREKRKTQLEQLVICWGPASLPPCGDDAGWSLRYPEGNISMAKEDNVFYPGRIFYLTLEASKEMLTPRWMLAARLVQLSDLISISVEI